MSTYSTFSPPSAPRLRPSARRSASAQTPSGLRSPRRPSWSRKQADGAQRIVVARNRPNPPGPDRNSYPPRPPPERPCAEPRARRSLRCANRSTNMASGGVVMFSTPSRFWCRCFSSRSSRADSFFESCAMRPSSIMALSVFSRLMDFCSVAQLVSVPPSQRWLTKNIPQRRASSATASCAWRLVPTKSTDASLPGQFAHKPAGLAEHLQGFLQIDDVDSIAFAEDIFLHLRVPTAGLVAEVNAGLQQFFHRNFNCQWTSSLDWMLAAPADSDLRSRASCCRHPAGHVFGPANRAGQPYTV